MASYRKRPWLNSKDQSKYSIKAIRAFNVDLDGANWYKVEWWDNNGRPWPGGNFTWQREAILVADGARQPIREFWSWLKTEQGKTKQSERKRILAENKQLRAAQESAITHKKPSATQKNPSISQKKPKISQKKPTSSRVKEAPVLRIRSGNNSNMIANTADDTTSEFSSSDRKKAGLDQNALPLFTGDESVENDVVVGERTGSEDDVSEEEFSHDSLDRANSNEEMPNCDEQANDLTASDYRYRLTPDFEPSSRRAKEFQLPLAKFTRGVSAFADLRRATITKKYFHGEDDEADEFLRGMKIIGKEIIRSGPTFTFDEPVLLGYRIKARKGSVELQDDPDLDDVFTDDESDPRIVKPSLKWYLQAGCTIEQFWETFRANPVEPGGTYDRKAFWEKYCRDRGLPVPEFEEYVDCEQPPVEQADFGSEPDAESELESDQESVYEDLIEANADEDMMDF